MACVTLPPPYFTVGVSCVAPIGASATPERIGLVYRSGSSFERAWSGIPAGLARGLSRLAFEPHPIDAEPGGNITQIAKAWARFGRGNRHGGMFSPEIRELRKLTARLRARRVQFDAIIQMGSDFGIPFFGRLVTYEDMTIPQRIRMDNIEEILGVAAIERWVAGQRRCYASAVGCCAMTTVAADSIIRDYKVDPKKVHVVWAGRNYDPRPIVRDWTKPRFFFMGYDWHRKNGPLVLEAFARLKARIPNARLDIAGGHPRIDADGVFPHGPLDSSDPRDRAHAEALFESATCFVMPSQFEPFGIVYVEAAAAGVPSIGTVVGGARDAIGDAGGLLVEPRDADALTESMEIMCNPSRASMMGAAALTRSDLFTWPAVAERIVHALDGAAIRGNDRDGRDG
jgi:glycosyltransferase involved in cell wall biosynthesis